MTGLMTPGLAVASLRYRHTAFVATFVATVLGTALVGTFATLLGTAVGASVASDVEMLSIIGGIVGSWGLLIVLFALISTVGITVEQRVNEFALLYAVGATRRQLLRMVLIEVGLVCMVAALGGTALAAGLGRVLVDALRDGEVLVSAEYDGAVVSLALTLVVVTAVGLIAAGVATRRLLVTSTGRDGVLSVSRSGSRWRLSAAVALIAYGPVSCAVTVLVTARSDDLYAPMMSSGSASIAVAIGLALIAPVLLRRASRWARPVLGHRGAGFLAAYNTAHRADQLGGVLGPVILFVAATTGTFMLTGIDLRTTTGLRPAAVETITLVNNMIAVMLALFAAILVVNTFAVSLARRRSELRRLWLLGATGRQLERSVVAEAAVVASVGIVLGLVAGATTFVPFAIARGEGVVPDAQLWLPPLVGAIAALLTLAAAGVCAAVVIRAVQGHAGARRPREGSA